MTKTQEIKLMIIENYIDWLTDDENERKEMKANAITYIDEDHVDEIQQAFFSTQNERQDKIDYIKRVINDWGDTNTSELELGSSPVLSSVGTNKNNCCELIEEFYNNHVVTVIYQNETEIGGNNYKYEDLPDDAIDEIYQVMQYYDKLREEEID